MSKVVKVICGLDGGNNSVKLAIEGLEEPVCYDNIYCERNEVALEKDYKRNGIKTANKFNIAGMLDVKVKSGESERSFLFGKQAQGFRVEATERVNNFKSDDAQLVRNSLVALANTVVSSMKSEDWKEELNVDTYLCTGLPFHEFETEERQEKYIKLFKGKHEITFNNPSYPIRKININVKEVEVEIEGLAALRQTLLDRGVMEQDLYHIIGKVSIMIDIGCYTTDIVGGIVEEDDIDEDGEPVTSFSTRTELCKGIINGVGTAIDNTIARLKEHYSEKLSQYDNFTRQDIIKAAQNKHVPGEIIGTSFNIEPFFKEECTKLGENIGMQFAQLYDASGYKNKILKIYIAGGGVYNNYIIESFKSTIKEKGYSEDLIDVVADPVYANAKGYYNIADAEYGE